jgi:thioredoxin-related protein
MKTFMPALTKHFLLGLVVSLVGCLPIRADEGAWLTDFSKAKDLAKRENKMILMDFTGSDWCPPCKLLHKNVLSTKVFEDFAQKRLVLVLVDFPRSKPQSPELKAANKELARQFDIEGYPTVIVLDSHGKQLSKDVGYGGATAKAFVAKLEKLGK